MCFRLVCGLVAGGFRASSFNPLGLARVKRMRSLFAHEVLRSKTLGLAQGVPYRRFNFGDSGVSMRKVVFLKRWYCPGSKMIHISGLFPEYSVLFFAKRCTNQCVRGFILVNRWWMNDVFLVKIVLMTLKKPFKSSPLLS